MPFSLHHVKGTHKQHDLWLLMLTLITQLKFARFLHCKVTPLIIPFPDCTLWIVSYTYLKCIPHWKGIILHFLEARISTKITWLSISNRAECTRWSQTPCLLSSSILTKYRLKWFLDGCSDFASKQEDDYVLWQRSRCFQFLLVWGEFKGLHHTIRCH